MRESVDTALKRSFRPEFLNRIDETIVFHPLNERHIIQIVELMLKDVLERLKERDVTFELTPDAETWLAREGFDPAYGARPLRRAIQRQLENPLARMVLSGEAEPGSHVLVDVGADGLILTSQQRPDGASNETLEPALV